MSIEITTTAKTCHCGMIYTVPNWMENNTSCPACSHRIIQDKERLIEDLENAIGKLYRRIAALQGVITKMKKPANLPERKNKLTFGVDQCWDAHEAIWKSKYKCDVTDSEKEFFYQGFYKGKDNA